LSHPGAICLILKTLVMTNEEKKVTIEVTEDEKRMLQEIRSHQLHPVDSDAFEIISSLEEFQVNMSDAMIQSLACLADPEPRDVAHYLTFFMYELFCRPDVQDNLAHAMPGFAKMMRLQTFLFDYQEAINLEDVERYKKQIKAGYAEEGI